MKIPCHQLTNSKDWICQAHCDTRLNCGHQCVRNCHLNEDPDHRNYRCEKDCARSCINDHKCKKKHPCHEECDRCNRSTNKTLNCGHEITVRCSQNIEDWKCQKPCQREPLPCGHTCLKICGTSCVPCIVSLKLFYFH